MQFIDVSTWDRAMHCKVFQNSIHPQYCVTFDIDVTNFLSQVKKGFLYILFCVCSNKMCK